MIMRVDDKQAKRITCYSAHKLHKATAYNQLYTHCILFTLLKPHVPTTFAVFYYFRTEQATPIVVRIHFINEYHRRIMIWAVPYDERIR